MGLYRFADKFLKILAVIFCTLIFLCAFFMTAYNYEMTGHYFEIRWDNVLISLAGMAIVFAVGTLLYLIIRRDFDKGLKIFLWIVIAWYFFVCEYLAFFGRSMPNSDAWVVYAMSKQIASGDLSIISHSGSYMSYYPQQIGICSFLALLIKIIDLFPVTIEEFHILTALYGIFECVTIYFLYKTVAALFKNRTVEFVFLFLSLFNFPFMMYSSYLYGEVPALMFFSLGAWMLARLYAKEGRPVIDIALAVVFLSLSVFVRKNSLILIIGVLIALVFESFKEKRIRYALTAGLIAICSFLILPLTIKLYENKAGDTLSTGVTALSYVAMGMQEIPGEINPGWYTAFNILTFEEAGMDPEAANVISKAAIAERKSEFLNDPGYALNFYWRKFITQWVDGTYFSRESTYNYYGDRSNLLMKLYFGEYGKTYVFVCNIFQSMVFLGAMLWSITALSKKKKETLFEAFIFIGIFGGFLFHMIWEANSRYIITYACLLVPYAAAGFADIVRGGRRSGRIS